MPLLLLLPVSLFQSDTQSYATSSQSTYSFPDVQKANTSARLTGIDLYIYILKHTLTLHARNCNSLSG